MASFDGEGVLNRVTRLLNDTNHHYTKQFSACTRGRRYQLFLDDIYPSFIGNDLVAAYTQLYHSANICTRHELHDWLKTIAKGGRAQEAEEFFNAEQEWDLALRSIDEFIQEDMFVYGDMCPLFVSAATTLKSQEGARIEVGSLFNRSVEALTLFVVGNGLLLEENRPYVDRLLEAQGHSNCQLFLVCTSRECARRMRTVWPKADVLADVARDLAASMAFKFSVWDACHTSRLHTMAQSIIREKASGEADLAAPTTSPDVYQLGGVVLVQSGGVVRFYHKSASSTDYPKADLLVGYQTAHSRHDRQSVSITNLDDGGSAVTAISTNLGSPASPNRAHRPVQHSVEREGPQQNAGLQQHQAANGDGVVETRRSPVSNNNFVNAKSDEDHENHQGTHDETTGQDRSKSCRLL